MIDPVLFSVGGHEIRWYGVLYAGGFIAAMIHLTLLGKRENRSAEEASDFILWAMIGGVIGARIAYVIANWQDQFAGDPLSMITGFRQGGLIYYGGLIAGVLTTILYTRVKKLPLWAFGDFIITALPLGHGLGRIGCFINGCCTGKVCSPDAFYAVHYAAGSPPLYPVQLFESLADFAVYLLLLFFYRCRHLKARVVALYLLAYPPLRFLTEMIRGDERMATGGLTVAQWISITMFVTGVALWFLAPKLSENRGSSSA